MRKKPASPGFGLAGFLIGYLLARNRSSPALQKDISWPVKGHLSGAKRSSPAWVLPYTGLRWHVPHGYEWMVNTAKASDEHTEDIILRTLLDEENVQVN